MKKDVIIVGGGASGFFTAINVAENFPDKSIAILERGKTGLQKVKISGGGRCNVTHAEFIPSELVTNYPRGEKELLGPFHTFMTGDTIAWFEDRGVELKIEDDGRMFPVTDSSQTIINCFLHEAKKLNIEVMYNHSLKTIVQNDGKGSQESNFILKTNQGDIQCKKLVIATGSNPKIWNLLSDLGHTIVKPVPSLFTFDIKDERLKDIPGVVVKDAEVSVIGSDLITEGPVLVTHAGLSAPAILKLSAIGAFYFEECDYNFKIRINFIKQTYEDALTSLKNLKLELAKKNISKFPQFDIPRRLWVKLCSYSKIEDATKWADLNRAQLDALVEQLTNAEFHVTGKSTFKEEFVTAGGVDLKELNFKTYESRRIPNLFLAGEVLNIDAVTGGFNFQNAWTGGYIVAQNIF
ncbi:NAD(P)/FAD-dependent oxidoreductase [Winogradskyella maritima]|uniref:NAD(P)/FAD-dependent oxidoreductase n=1 Tax=Winogradskyella maritima TaxID=1517766 RepID=A0ABV8AGL4_9FLAO|nr:NAD(P)/FAD-dependent oxidoreductase [Winogradskyella maritima]